MRTDIDKRSEILFLYDAKDCDPNGDPFTGEPRFDEDTQKIMVSDVRIKRYIRDFIDKYESDENNNEVSEKSKIIFYSSLGDTETVGGRRKSLKEFVKKDDTDDILKKCIDIRLFGCVLAESGANVDLTGTVQFKNMNRSLNHVELKPLQNTSVMKSKEKNTQGAMATTTQVPYALISVIGYINPKTAEYNMTKRSDISLMLKAMWNQVNLINTRSKAGQTSRFLLKVNYIDQFSKISDLESSISLNDEDENSYRNFKEIESNLDFSDLKKLLSNNKEIIESIDYKIDESYSYENLNKLINDLKKFDIEVNKLSF